MLTAQDERGQRIILRKEQTTDDLKKLRNKHQFYCEVCLCPVTLKIGEHITPHFAHKPNSSCEGDNEPESTSHLEGKWSLYQWLQNQGESPIIEQYLPGIKQRADIGLPNRHIVIEYQCSSLSPSRFKERTKGYLSKKVEPLWILGANRLEQSGANTFKWMQTDHLMLQNNHNGNSPYAIFFSGKTNNVTFLFNFWSMSSNHVIADTYTIPITELKIEQLSLPPLPSCSTEKKQLAWLRQKEKWRTQRLPHQSKLERYVQTICRTKGLSLSFFPSYVGLPIPNDLCLSGSPYLWQAWLVLQFLYQRPIGTTIPLKTIEEAFQRLVDKKVIFLRDNKAAVTKTFKKYLTALERFSIIENRKDRQYVIRKMVCWQTKSLSVFRNEDAASLWRWLELEI